MVLICTSLMENNVEYLSMCLLAVREMLSSPLITFKLHVFLVLSYNNYF